MKKKTLQKTILAGTIFSAALNFNACAYGPPEYSNTDTYSDGNVTVASADAGTRTGREQKERTYSVQKADAQAPAVHTETLEVRLLKIINNRNYITEKDYYWLLGSVSGSENITIVAIYVQNITRITDETGNLLEITDLKAGQLIRAEVSVSDLNYDSEVQKRYLVEFQTDKTYMYNRSYESCDEIQILNE